MKLYRFFPLKLSKRVKIKILLSGEHIAAPVFIDSYYTNWRPFLIRALESLKVRISMYRWKILSARLFGCPNKKFKSKLDLLGLFNRSIYLHLYLCGKLYSFNYIIYYPFFLQFDIISIYFTKFFPHTHRHTYDYTFRQK
jgi:hypothetical protein